VGSLSATLQTQEDESQSWAKVAGLVRRAQDGDRDAFGLLVQQFEPTVKAIALRRLGNQNEALELTQEVFLHVMRRLGQLREPERFAGWLRQVTARMAINRATRRVPPQAVETGVLEAAAENADEPIHELISRERAARLWTAMDRLKPLDREALVAFYIRDLSLIEMADELDIPLGTVKRRLHTARKRLKTELESSVADADEWSEGSSYDHDEQEAEELVCVGAGAARGW